VEVNRKKLLADLRYLQGYVSSLICLLESNPEDGTIKVVASDRVSVATTTIPVEDVEDMRVYFNMDILIKLLIKLNCETVAIVRRGESIYLETEQGHYLIRAASEFQLEWPQLEVKTSLPLNPELVSAILLVSNFIDPNATTESHKYISLKGDGKTLRIAGIYRHAMACVVLENPCVVKAMLPLSLAQSLEVAEHRGSMIHIGATTVAYEDRTRYLIARTTDVDVPDISALLSKLEVTDTLLVASTALVHSLERLSLDNLSDSVTLEKVKGALRVSSPTGNHETLVDVTGSISRIVFSPRLLAKSLKTLPGDIELGTSDPMLPMVVTSGDAKVLISPKIM